MFSTVSALRGICCTISCGDGKKTLKELGYTLDLTQMFTLYFSVKSDKLILKFFHAEVLVDYLRDDEGQVKKSGEWIALDPATKENLEDLLAKNPCSIAGLVLRLAWRAGLLRNEIQSLQWDQVDFDKKQLHLPNRDIPICEDLDRCLAQWKTLYGEYGPYVAVSEKFHRPLTPESISNLVRITLRNAGIANVRLADLHYNYNLEQIAGHGWQQALRTTGLSRDSFWKQRYKVAHVEDAARSIENHSLPNNETCDRERLKKILEDNRSTPAGVALWLAYSAGLQYKEIAALTWQQVDLEHSMLRLADRDVAINDEVTHLLRECSKRRRCEEAAQVILSPQARKPMPLERLCKLTRELLVQGGMDNMLPKALREENERQMKEDLKQRILLYIAQHDGITSEQCSDIFDITKQNAQSCLNELLSEKKVERDRGFYLTIGKGTIAQQRKSLIKDYIARHDACTANEISESLGMSPRMIQRAIKPMIEQGEIIGCADKSRSGFPFRYSITDANN